MANEEVVLQSWERQESDTTKSFQAFAIYRDMGVERSTHKVARQLSKSWELISRWSRTNNWVQRCADYDAYLDGQYRKMAEADHIEELKEFRQRMRANAQEKEKAANLLMKNGVKRLERNFDEAPGTIASVMRAAAALADVALQQEAAALGIDELLRRLPE